MTATIEMIECAESYAEWFEVRVPGYHWPVASFKEVEDAEDLVRDTDRLAQAISNHRVYILANWTAEDIQKHNLIPTS